MAMNLKSIITNKIVITIIIIIVLLLIIFYIHIRKEEKWNNQDITNAIHGVIVKENTLFYRKPKESRWRLIKETKIGENAYIIEEIEEENEKWYKVKINDKVGYVKKDAVKYFEFENGNKKTLMSDVSKFNILYKHFENSGDYEAFILKSNINYVYIRLGGRGYGEEGNFYVDPNIDIFIDACEYLEIPYGFYYIDEAINSEEVQEEIDFVKDLIKKNKTKMCMLPLVIDVETYDGIGRADNLDEERAVIVDELVQKFRDENIETIIYANAKYASDFLYTVDTKFWIAYYDLQKQIPYKWYTETDQEAALNEELMNKLVAWQFTETGAGEQITYPVDVSLVDNTFFRNFVNTVEE